MSNKESIFGEIVKLLIICIVIPWAILVFTIKYLVKGEFLNHNTWKETLDE